MLSLINLIEFLKNFSGYDPNVWNRIKKFKQHLGDGCKYNLATKATQTHVISSIVSVSCVLNPIWIIMNSSFTVYNPNKRGEYSTWTVRNKSIHPECVHPEGCLCDTSLWWHPYNTISITTQTYNCV